MRIGDRGTGFAHETGRKYAASSSIVESHHLGKFYSRLLHSFYSRNITQIVVKNRTLALSIVPIVRSCCTSSSTWVKIVRLGVYVTCSRYPVGIHQITARNDKCVSRRCPYIHSLLPFRTTTRSSPVQFIVYASCEIRIHRAVKKYTYCPKRHVGESLSKISGFIQT